MAVAPLALLAAVRLLPADVRDEVLRELIEQHMHVISTRGAAAARWWSWRQIGVCFTAARAGRSKTHASTHTLREGIAMGFRSLRRQPALSATVILTVAVSVGAIAAIASIIDAVMLRPLPFPSPERLVWMASYSQDPGDAPFDRADAQRAYANPLDVVDWASRGRRMSALAPFESGEGTLKIGERPLRVDVAMVGAAMTRVLQVKPLYGRLFNDEDAAAKPRAMVLTYPLWKSAFGGDPSIVGRSVVLNDTSFDVVGVLPDLGFGFPTPATQVWLPLAPLPADFANRGGVWQRVIGRIDANASMADAQADMTRVARDLTSEHPKTNENRFIALVPLREALVGSAGQMLWLLGGAVGLVLVIACANVGHLLLVSAQSRRRELVLRAALGANARQIAALLFGESLWLTAIGGLIGLGLGQLLIRAFVSLYPETLPAVGAVSMSGLAVAAAALAVALSAVLAVVPSLLQASSRHLRDTMQSGARTGDSRGQRRLRSGLVIAQVALSTTLLIGGGLLVRTFLAMQRVDPGFSKGSVLTFNVAMSSARYPKLADEVRFHEQLIENLKALPGVTSAGTTTLLPFAPGEFGDGFFRAGFNDAAPNIPIARLQAVTSGYFDAAGISVRSGRALSATDTAESTGVVVVNEELQRRYFADGALGRHITFRGRDYEVVGVVADKHHRNLRDAPRPEMFYPRAKISNPRLFSWVAVRAAGDAMTLLPAVRDVVNRLDSGIAIADPQLLSRRVDRALAPDRFRAALIGALAIVALLLSSIGLYGLIAHTVAQETRNIAIRMALGARAAQTTSRVLQALALLTATGALVGVAGAWYVRGSIQQFLVGVSPSDPATMIVVSLLLIAVALLAAIGPAARASRVDPSTVLRGQ